MKRRTLRLALPAMAATCWIACLPCPARSGAAECMFKVSAPRPGQAVGKAVIVEGDAVLPAGYHLWVFARRASYRDGRVWWPQGEGVPDTSTGRWKVAATIGVAQDLGHEFDVGVAVFARAQDLQLREELRQVQLSQASGPSEMPTSP
jgi:hypothetical protein